ncbi:MAG: nucleoside triphosphate pyrophosphohydrolase [Flavobacteriaceae bacterium]
MEKRTQQLQAFDRLLTIMDELRSQCPWDRKQTFESLRHLTIEETYELSDALLADDVEEVKKELGDLLLHIVFYAKIGSELSAFDIADVANEICDKLIQRHPHVYGDVEVRNEEEVKQNWEQIKLKEGRKGVLAGVPKGLPSLVKAHRMQEKAAGVGFDWKKTEDVALKIQEELGEFLVEVQNGDSLKTEAEFGDLIFSLVNYARFMGINADDALARTNQKFVDRFELMEQQLQDRGKKISDLDLDALEKLWQSAKEMSKSD